MIGGVRWGVAGADERTRQFQYPEFRCSLDKVCAPHSISLAVNRVMGHGNVVR